MFDDHLIETQAMKSSTASIQLKNCSAPVRPFWARNLFSFTLLITLSLSWACACFAQEHTPATNTVTAKPTRISLTKPAWADLSPLQKQSLKPLNQSWDTAISEAQKRKWLEISKNYSQLSPDDQVKLHSRMNEWITLSPQQRTEARLNFAKTQELSKQLSSEEKNAQWQNYQALSAEEKQKLAAKAKADRHIGAAPAVRPVAPQKLAAVQPRAARSNNAEQQTMPAKSVASSPADGRATIDNLPSAAITPKN
jgi:hypothetical protein